MRWRAHWRRRATPSSGSTLADPIDLGGEFVRWEVATAIAGAVLGIDPFDQPNVEEAKELTREVLATAGRGEAHRCSAQAALDGRRTRPLTPMPSPPTSADARQRLPRPPGVHRPDTRPRRGLRPDPRHPARRGRATPRPPATARASSIRPASCTRAARPIGWFLQLTADHPDDREIPGWPYTFGQLIDAQADGDFAALDGHGLPILRIHLGADPDAGLAALERALEAALRTTPEG